MNKTIPLLLMIALFGAAAWYFFTAQPAAVHKLPPPALMPAEPLSDQQTRPDLDGQDVKAILEPEPLIIPDPLPPLLESDAAVSQALVQVVGADNLALYLVKSEIISRMVATIDSLTSRQVPAQINPVKPPAGSFQTDYDTEILLMSRQNFSRYNGHVSFLQNTDSEALMAIYRRYYPLIQTAWEENGGEGAFTLRLLEVIDVLLATPDVPGPVQLTKPEAVYLFVAPELESMSAGQKMLVRMGSANAAVVKDKLQEIQLLLQQ